MCYLLTGKEFNNLYILLEVFYIMAKGIIIGVVIVIVLVFGILVYFLAGQMSGPVSGSVSNSNPASTSSPVGSGSSNKQTGTGAIMGAKMYNIDIKGFAFTPSSLNIKVGDTITWKNGDSASHTVTSDSGSELNSAILNTGQSYSHIFNTVGTYKYHCSFHSSMHGTIIVQ